MSMSTRTSVRSRASTVTSRPRPPAPANTAIRRAVELSTSRPARLRGACRSWTGCTPYPTRPQRCHVNYPAPPADTDFAVTVRFDVVAAACTNPLTIQDQFDLRRRVDRHCYHERRQPDTIGQFPGGRRQSRRLPADAARLYRCGRDRRVSLLRRPRRTTPVSRAPSITSTTTRTRSSWIRPLPALPSAPGSA